MSCGDHHGVTTRGHPRGVRLSVDPRLRVLYVLGVAVGVFLVRAPAALAALLALQVALWLAAGLPPRRLVRQITKLWGFTLFVLASYALTSESPEVDRWIAIGGW